MRIGQSTASDPRRKDGTMYHAGRHLKVIAISDRIIGFINTLGQETGDKLRFLSV